MKKNKFLATLYVAFVTGTYNLAQVHADFDENAAKTFINGYLNPITNVLLVLVPAVTTAMCIYKYIKWAAMDEDEQQQKPIFKTIKNYIFWAVIIESLTVIFKIFGISE